jgi:hypothetical protein
LNASGRQVVAQVVDDRRGGAAASHDPRTIAAVPAILAAVLDRPTMLERSAPAAGTGR